MVILLQTEIPDLLSSLSFFFRLVDDDPEVLAEAQKALSLMFPLLKRGVKAVELPAGLAAGSHGGVGAVAKAGHFEVRCRLFAVLFRDYFFLWLRLAELSTIRL